MSVMRSFGPPASVGLVALLSALPWGLSPEIRFVMPLIPFVAIHFWIVRDEEAFGEWFVFSAGLMLDVLTNGPLGFWSIVYLIGYALSTMLAEQARTRPLGGWAALVVVVSCLAVVEWAVSSLYFLELMDWRPLALAALFAAAAYPVLALVLGLAFDATGRRGQTGAGLGGLSR